MNKLIKLFFIIACIVGTTASVYAAGTTFLFKISKFTYAKSYHANYMITDSYDGEVSVRGTDRFYTGSYTAYPTYSRITYDIQGDISSKQINSKSKSDGTQRKATITVYDKWNFGSSSKVYGSYGRGWVSNSTPYKISDEEE